MARIQGERATYLKLGNKIRELRKSVKMSQTELAKVIGNRSQGGIVLYETGQRRPDLDVLMKICKHFKIGMEYFITDKWRVSRQKNQAVLILDGLDLRLAFDQYLEETPFEELRSTEEVRLKALQVPENLSKNMVQFAETERLWYSYCPTPKEWNMLEKKVALRRGGFKNRQ